MSNIKATNPYHAGIVGESRSMNKALVVNIQDPLEQGRVQIRVTGHMDDLQRIPDEKLPWIKIKNGTHVASLQTAGMTHGLLPGSMVSCEKMGNDWIVTGTLPNDNKEQQSTPPLQQGAKASDKRHPDKSTKQKGQGKYGWPKVQTELAKVKTTQEAQQIRDNLSRIKQLTEESVRYAQQIATSPTRYGDQAAPKWDDLGNMAGFKFDNGKNPQQFIQSTIQNVSSILPNALSSIENLKKVASNPTSIQSIGAGNFGSLIGQISGWFGGGSKSSSNQQQDQQTVFDCEILLATPDELLTESQLIIKDQCKLLQEELYNAETS